MGPPDAGRSSLSPPAATPRRSTAPRTISRSDLERRHSQFAAVSPEVGELDAEALDEALRANTGGALHLLADLTTATDERLRDRARRLAGRILLDLGRGGPARRGGSGRLHPVPADRGGELDIDLSMDALSVARADGRNAALDELTARDWRRPDLALCLLVDASGSMTGDRLAVAALTAAACSWRAPGELAVLSFAREVRVHRSITAATPAVDVVDGLLTLRGHGVTSVAGALRAASEQLAGARAARRVTVLLSDCRATDELDPIPAACAQEELIVLAPADDCVEAGELAAAADGRMIALASAADAPSALAEALSR